MPSDNILIIVENRETAAMLQGQTHSNDVLFIGLGAQLESGFNVKFNKVLILRRLITEESVIKWYHECIRPWLAEGCERVLV